MDQVLFISHTAQRCGVYQFGKLTAALLAKSRRFQLVYVECPDSDPRPFLTALERHAPAAVIYNWHPTTMPWLGEDVLRLVQRLCPRLRHASLVHDFAPPYAQIPSHFYIDPTVPEGPGSFVVGRILPEYTPDPARPAPVNVIGSFGFAAERKGYLRLVEQVNQEFDTAVVRLHLAAGHYGDRDGRLARETFEACRALAKPGVTIESSHHFMETGELIDWLAGNSVNCFFYDRLDGAGVSSAIDYALAARRPIAITDSCMFRHIVGASPTILIERTSLGAIIRNGFAPLEPFYRRWTEKSVLANYERAVSTMLAQHDYNLTSNRVLTPRDREELRPAVEELRSLDPDIMSRKISEAVFQNAFIFEQVRRLARPTDRIMLVGGFEDPIGPALRRLGYQVEIADPNLDGRDMDAVWRDAHRSGTEYDLAVACSVVEHVEDDVRFILQLYQILRPGGIGLLTTDFRADWQAGVPKPGSDVRMYTAERLRHLLEQLPADSSLDPPTWGNEQPYFNLDGASYGFCSLAFRRRLTTLAYEYLDGCLQNQRRLQDCQKGLLEERHEAVARVEADLKLQRSTSEWYLRLLQEQQAQTNQCRVELEQHQSQLADACRRLASIEGLGQFSLGVARRVHKASKKLPWLSRHVRGMLKTARLARAVVPTNPSGPNLQVGSLATTDRN